MYCTKQNVDQNKALETEPLGLTLHKKENVFCADREVEAAHPQN